MRKETILGKIPETRKNIESDPDVPQDADSDDPKTIVDNLSDEQFDEAWDVEAKSWFDMGLNPAVNITPDLFQLKSKVDIILQVLVENELIKEEVFLNRMKRHMLVSMLELRREHESNMLRAKLMEGVQPAAPKPGMFLPPGMKM